MADGRACQTKEIGAAWLREVARRCVRSFGIIPIRLAQRQAMIFRIHWSGHMDFVNQTLL